MHSPALLPSIRVISNVLAELPNCILLRNVKDNKIPSFSNFTNPMCTIELILRMNPAQSYCLIIPPESQSGNEYLWS